MARIASRISQLNGEGALAVFARAKELEHAGRSIIHLELGEPDFHPAAPIVDALRAAVAAGHDRYVSPRGIPALRKTIADETTLRYGAMQIDVFSLLTEARQRVAANLAAIEAQRDFWIADTELEAAVTGGGSNSATSAIAGGTGTGE